MEGKDLMIFTNDRFGNVRVVMKDDKPYFVGKDVAICLGYVNTVDALKKHCRYIAKCTVPHPQSATKTLEVSAIPESDLYRLVFGSELPNAIEFQDWVCDEVLPSIRKKGYYSVAPVQADRASLIMSIVDAPDDVTTALAVKNFENFVTAPLKEEIAELKPKSDYCDEVLSAENTFSASEVAAQLGIRSATALNKFLVSVEFIKAVYKRQYDKKTGKYKKVIAHYLLRADYVDKGLGDVVNVTSKSKDGSKTYSNLQLRWTTKGVKFIYELIKEKAPEMLGNKNNNEAV